MQLEDMSTAELIALVKRQEQELATARALPPFDVGNSELTHFGKIYEDLDGVLNFCDFHATSEHIGASNVTPGTVTAGVIASLIINRIVKEVGYALIPAKTGMPVQQPALAVIPWWVEELEKHWGHGELSHDTRRAAKVACDQFYAAPVAAPVAIPDPLEQFLKDGGLHGLDSAPAKPSYQELLGTLQQVTTEREEARGAAHKLRAALAAVQPDSGRDAALRLARDFIDGRAVPEGTKGASQAAHYARELVQVIDATIAAHPANVAQAGELSDAQMPTKQEIIEFGASLVDHASTTDRMNEREIIEWATARFDEWFAAMSAPAKAPT